MKRRIDIVGKRYGRLTVIEYGPDWLDRKGKHWGRSYCQCDCGMRVLVRDSSLRSGLTVSCGCYNRERAASIHRTHGFSHKDPLYTVWKGIRERCTNPRQIKNWRHYGGRGITVCREWDDFMSFRTWALSHGWRRGLQIDRIDNDKGYSPDNCRCVTGSENCKNRRPRPHKSNGQFAKSERSVA